MNETCISNSTPVAEVISVSLTDRDKLQAAYMPFVAQGGLFIPTQMGFQLGDCVNIQLELLEQNYLLKGKVVWITPPLAQGGKPAGIGIQLLGKEGQLVLTIIEQELKGLESDKYTYTL